MDVDTAVDVVAKELARTKGAALTKGTRNQLRALFQIGRARALHERDEAAFDAAVMALAHQVGATVQLQAMEGGEIRAIVTSQSFEMALRDLCPLWPFC